MTVLARFLGVLKFSTCLGLKGLGRVILGALPASVAFSRLEVGDGSGGTAVCGGACGIGNSGLLVTKVCGGSGAARTLLSAVEK